jgi:DNA-binding PadR family transcriptional regulator
MINITSNELALLVLIAEKPRHGYQIEQLIQERGMREWTHLAFSSIYYLLNHLVEKGLATAVSKPAAGKGPARKVFSITTDGRTAMQKEVHAALASADPDARVFLLGLSGVPFLPSAEVAAALRAREKILQERSQSLANHPAVTNPHFPSHVRNMFEYSLSLLFTEITWLRTYLETFNKEL